MGTDVPFCPMSGEPIRMPDETQLGGLYTPPGSDRRAWWLYCPTCGRRVNLAVEVVPGAGDARWPDHAPGVPQTARIDGPTIDADYTMPRPIAPEPHPEVLARVRQIAGHRLYPGFGYDGAARLPHPADEAIARGQAHLVFEGKSTYGEVREYWDRVAVERAAETARALAQFPEIRGLEIDRTLGRTQPNRQLREEIEALRAEIAAERLADAGLDRLLEDIDRIGPDITETTLVVTMIHEAHLTDEVLADHARRVYNLDAGIIGVTVKIAREPGEEGTSG